MLSQEQVDQFHRDGFLRSGRILSDDQLGTLQDELVRVLADKDKPGIPQPALIRWGTQAINIWEASRPFCELIHNPVILEEMAQITGASTLRIWHDQVQNKPPVKGGVAPWHQDAPYWSVITPMTGVTAWVAFDDVDEENGCMRMVPGSHLWGNTMNFLHTLKDISEMPGEYDGHKIEIQPCPVARGEVHYHHGLTWHASGQNTSERPRRAASLHYMTGESRFVASGDHVMKPFIEVADGELMRGEHFPIVWDMTGLLADAV